jgi:small subunit ribosomal protein S17
VIGKITSNKMTGTVAVTVESIKIHPLYGKRLRRSRKFLARAPEKLNLGDLVEIKETRPASRRVRFVVIKVLNRVEVLPQIKEEGSDRSKAPSKSVKPKAKAGAKK